MHAIAYLLPTVLLILKFVVKLLVGQSPSIPKTIALVYALPVDIIFMATSFAAAFTLSSPRHLDHGLLWVLGLVIAAIAVTALWRGSTDFLDVKRHGWAATLFVTNAVLSVTLLYAAINLFPEARV